MRDRCPVDGSRCYSADCFDNSRGGSCVDQSKRGDKSGSPMTPDLAFTVLVILVVIALMVKWWSK